jgi:hypothetical protein
VITVITEGEPMAGRARAVTVRLTIKRHRKLEQIVRAATSPQRLVLRARIVLLAAGGMTNAGIARQLGCSAWRWRADLAGPVRRARDTGPVR